MGNPAGEPSGSIQSWSIAGYDLGGDWYQTEGEIVNADQPEPDDLAQIDEAVIHVVDSDGVDWYFQLDGPWEDYDSLYDAIGDLYGEYGGEAA